MSSPREQFVLIIIVNLLITGIVVAGALTVFSPAAPEAGPADLSGIEDALARLDSRLESAELKARERELALVDRIAELERANRSVPNSGEVVGPAEPVQPGKASPTAEPTAAEALAQGLGEMIKVQAKRRRDEYIEELLNPTEKGQKQQERMLARVADDVAKRLELDESQKADLSRILKDVDERRRQKFRDLVLSKQSPDDVTYEEVKAVMDESYEDEDRLIEQALPADKAEEYQETAQPFRQMIDFGTKSAFPPAADSDR